ncbi:MAG: type II TA system antitoxin MqsA family protein [Eubacterium sp.]|jgi:putative zinc finger/helix-turn-helix YgiT family protein
MVMLKKYCDSCRKKVDTKVIKKTETYEVFGESIEVDADVLVCAECGEELFCEGLDNATLVRVYDEYRRRHKLLMPEEIKKIRMQYGLSQRGFAKLLNWGDKTIYRYENGSIQDKAHNSILLFLREPENMRRYLIENEVHLTKKQKDKLLTTIEKLERSEENPTHQIYFNLFALKVPDEENGYKVFDYDKFCAMVLFFANNNKELLETKLMKLLNYADMVFYKENGVSISGTKYAHLPYGPVPDHFEILLDSMEADNIAHIEISFENGYEKHQVVPNIKMPDNALSPEEIDVMERVNNKFSSFGSYEISNYSHREKGYCSTKNGEIIPYTYAKYIDLE